MNYLDIAIGLFMLYAVVMGYIHGVVRSLFNLLGYIVAALITHFYYPIVKKMIVDLTSFDDKMNHFVTDKLQQMGAQSAQATVTVSDLNAMNQLPLPNKIKESIQTSLTSSANAVTENIASVVTDVIISFLAIVGLFLIVLLIFKITSAIFDLIAKLPVLKTFNKLGGVLFGFVKGYIVISVLFVVMISVLSLGTHPIVESLMKDSYAATFFIENNILLMWFSQFS
jgi:uncharacterized membrane protein required for colicin V production